MFTEEETEALVSQLVADLNQSSLVLFPLPRNSGYPQRPMIGKLIFPPLLSHLELEAQGTKG